MLFPLHCEVQLLARWDAGATRKNPGPPTYHCHLWWDGDSLPSSLGWCKTWFGMAGGCLQGCSHFTVLSQPCWLRFYHSSVWGTVSCQQMH